MPLQKLVFILVAVIALSGVTILIGQSLSKASNLSGTTLSVVWVAVLLGFAGWRLFLRYSRSGDKD